MAFVLAATDHGPLIVSRLDMHPLGGGVFAGVGYQLLEWGAYETDEVALTLALLALRRRHHGKGVVAIDGGANVGVLTIEWARAMTGWGSVLAIEAQERLFYALAGNIALSNCFNARAMHGAIAGNDGTIAVPVPDYCVQSSVSSLELRPGPANEFIGQAIDYAADRTVPVAGLRIDTLALPRVDLLKLDIEGMEPEGLEGAAGTLARDRPIILLEWIKCDAGALGDRLRAVGYRVFMAGNNLLGVHESDAVLNHVEPMAPPVRGFAFRLHQPGGRGPY